MILVAIFFVPSARRRDIRQVWDSRRVATVCLQNMRNVWGLFKSRTWRRGFSPYAGWLGNAVRWVLGLNRRLALPEVGVWSGSGSRATVTRQGSPGARRACGLANGS